MRNTCRIVLALACLVLGTVPAIAHAKDSPEAESGWKVDERRPTRFFWDSDDRAPRDSDWGWKVDQRRPWRFFPEMAGDEDHDGVADSRDRCPETPRGTRVDDRGCAESVAKVEKASKPAPVAKPAAKSTKREEELIRTGELHLENVYFDIGAASIQTESHEVLNEVADMLVGRPELRIEIGGHTDDQGTAESNFELSRRRAQAVLAYLTARKPELRGRLTSRGYGESRPIATNDSVGGRAKNRRVTLKVM